MILDNLWQTKDPIGFLQLSQRLSMASFSAGRFLSSECIANSKQKVQYENA